MQEFNALKTLKDPSHMQFVPRILAGFPMPVETSCEMWGIRWQDEKNLILPPPSVQLAEIRL